MDVALRTVGLRIKVLGLDRVVEGQRSGDLVVDPDHPAFHVGVESPALEPSEARAV